MIRKKLTAMRFCLDACCVNARGNQTAIARLEDWHAKGVIDLFMPEHAQREAEAGGDTGRTKKSRCYWIPQEFKGADEEWKWHEIARILFRDKPLTPNERNDVSVVFTAQKYSCILVTTDGASKRQPRGILGAAADLAKFGITVMRPSEAADCVQQRLRWRDSAARRLSESQAVPLEEWVGND